MKSKKNNRKIMTRMRTKSSMKIKGKKKMNIKDWKSMQIL